MVTSYFYAATVGALLSKNSHLNHFTNFGVPPKFDQYDMPSLLVTQLSDYLTGYQLAKHLE